MRNLFELNQIPKLSIEAWVSIIFEAIKKAYARKILP